MENLFIGAAGGLIAGAILLFVEYIVRRTERRHEIAHQQVVKFANEERRITGSIFSYLGPGSSIELMRSELGPPNKKIRERIGLFSSDSPDSSEETNAYVYLFKNAVVKITSRDGNTIESLSVVASDAEKDIKFNNLFFVDPDAKDEFLNVTTLTPEMLEECRVEDFAGCYDSFVAAQRVIENPFCVYQTYFCELSEDIEVITDKPELLAGAIINGLCLSAQAETTTYPFITDRL